MNEVKFLICGNNKKEIIQTTENLKLYFKLNIIIKDCSNGTHIENIEYFFLINDIQNFNAFILNYEKKKIFFYFLKHGES